MKSTNNKNLGILHRILSLVLALILGLGVFAGAAKEGNADLPPKTNTVVVVKLILNPDTLNKWDSDVLVSGIRVVTENGEEKVVNIKGERLYRSKDLDKQTKKPNISTKAEGNIPLTKADIEKYNLKLHYDASLYPDDFWGIAQLNGLVGTGDQYVAVENVLFAWTKLFDDPDPNHPGQTIPVRYFINTSGEKLTAFKKNATDPDIYIKTVDEFIKYYDKSNTIGVFGFQSSPMAEYTSNGEVNGSAVFETEHLPAGQYRIEEILPLSENIGTWEVTTPDGQKKLVDGNVIVGGKAIPMDITLPVVNENGALERAFVFPKNMTDKPKADKNLQKDNKCVEFIKPGAETNKTLKVGAVIENWDKDKATVTAKVGDEIPYETLTRILSGAQYGKLVLTDTFDQGLTFKALQKIELGYLGDKERPKDPNNPALGKETYQDFILLPDSNIELVEGSDKDYTLTQDDRGFTVFFTKTGLEKLKGIKTPEIPLKDPNPPDPGSPGGSGQAPGGSGQFYDLAIKLSYTATVNANAEVDQELNNQFAVDYDHKPGKEVTQVPVTPNNGELEVKKAWKKRTLDATGLKYEIVDDAVPTDGKTRLVYTLSIKDSQGKPVNEYSILLNGKEAQDQKIILDKVLKSDSSDYDHDGNGQWKDVHFQVTGPYQGNFVNLPAGEPGKPYTYTLSERVAGRESTIVQSVDANNMPIPGQYTITNKKDESSPPPIIPTNPKVITGGKRFVKASKGNTRLFGAKFYVKRTNPEDKNKTQYLALKTNGGQAVDFYQKQEEKYLKAIKGYNEAIKKNPFSVVIDGTTYTDKNQALEKIGLLKAERDEKFRLAREAYDWVDKADFGSSANPLVLTSNDKGQIQVDGLGYGDYILEEKEAPDGYAKTQDVPFTVTEGSLTVNNNTGESPNVTVLTLDYVKDKDGSPGTALSYSDLHSQNAGELFALKIENRKVTIPQTGGLGTYLYIGAGLFVLTMAFISFRRLREQED